MQQHAIRVVLPVASRVALPGVAAALAVRLAVMWVFGLLIIALPALVGVPDDRLPALAFLLGFVGQPAIAQLIRESPAGERRWPWRLGSEFWRIDAPERSARDSYITS